jgi:hypothetical protein
MNRLKRWTSLVALAGVSACAPINPSETAVVGKWKVEWTCGVETLELKSDGVYTHTIEFASSGRAADSGRWKIVSSTERLTGAHIILQGALEAHSVSGEKAVHPERRDRELETIWEWGRTILSFHPDIQGFTRVND